MVIKLNSFCFVFTIIPVFVRKYMPTYVSEVSTVITCLKCTVFFPLLYWFQTCKCAHYTGNFSTLPICHFVIHWVHIEWYYSSCDTFSIVMFVLKECYLIQWLQLSYKRNIIDIFRMTKLRKILFARILFSF